jgi:hypothetical protein
MKRFATLLDWLNHNEWPLETQPPVQASVIASLLSFLFILCVDERVVSLLGIWWAEFLVYAFVPLLLAFVILYRGSWHRELSAPVRAFLSAALSGVIFVGVLIALGVAGVLLALVYYRYLDNFTAFHY